MNSISKLSDNSQAPQEQTGQQLLFDSRFLEQYTGRLLLYDPVSAIVEFVANGWDAGATRVVIDGPVVPGGLLRDHANGAGMPDDLIQTKTK